MPGTTHDTVSIPLIHPKQAKPLSQSLGNQWKEAPGFWLRLSPQLVMYVQAYCIVLLFSFVP